MTDPAPLPPHPDSAENIRSMQDFVQQYGSALAAWALLEEVLGMNFQRLTLLSPSMARLLFFSGRSFATRADLYSAAISGAVGLSEFQRSAHKAVLKRSRQFSSARNSIAHGIPINLSGGGPYQGIRIKQGHKVWEPGGVSRDDLLTATENFQKLSDAAKTLLYVPEDEAAQQSLTLIDALPTEAFPREADPIPPAGK